MTHPKAIPAITTPTNPTDLHAAVLDFIRRGQRAQATVDAILAAEPERRRAGRPKGSA